MRAIALGVLLAAAPAHADVSPGDAARATQLFEQGHKLVDGGKIDAACDAFAESLHLDPQIGTRLNLADCRERQNRLVEAHLLYEQVVAEATKTGKEGRATFAREHLAALDKKLGHVTVHAPAGTTVLLQNAPMGSDPQAVEPGPVVVDATAPGHKPFHVERTVAAGETVTVDVAFEPDAVRRPPAVVETPASRRPLIVTASGGALVLASAIIGLHARSRWSDASDARDADGVSSAQHEADIATGVFALGAVAIAAGVYLYVRTPHGHVVVQPTADSSSAGVLVGGSF